MAAPTITNGQEHFFPIIYEGNGAGQRVGRFIPFTDQATVANSCLIQPVAQRRLGRTPSSNGSGTILTFSAWVKRGRLGSISSIFIANDYASVGEALEFNTSNQLNYYCIKSSPGSYDWNYITNRTFEDTSKWYHIMVARDTTDSTQADRVQIYIDGEKVTSWNTETQAGSNLTGWMNQTTYENSFGNTNNASYVRGIGYLAEMNMIDGQALLPASFGITDTSTGRWIPKTVEPFPTTTTDIAVTVVSSGGNKYALDGVTQGTVTLIEGATYKFDQSDSSNSGHPLRFSTTSDGTHGGGSEFTSGVTTAGTPGSSGAYTQITVPTGTATLYYYCSVHSGMGGTANTQDQYGTNGFRCKFQDSSALGDDTSGKGNDLTATGMSTTNQTTDSPTQNHATLSPHSLYKSSNFTLSEGNLKATSTSAAGTHSGQGGMRIPNGGKYYWECEIDAGKDGMGIGIIPADTPTTSANPSTATLYLSNGSMRTDGSNAISYGSGVSNGDIMGFALDLSNPANGKLYVSVNGTYENSGNPVTGANPAPANPLIGDFRVIYQDGSNGYTPVYIYNFGQKSFNTAPPTGFSALQQDNLPETVKGISGLVWTKNRDSTDNHILMDSSRGAGQRLESTETGAQILINNSLNKFLAGGQQIGSYADMNRSGNSFVSWNWVANAGTTASNTDGSVTSTVQANTTAGFSIVQFTAPSAGNFTTGHGLSSTPEWVIVRMVNATSNWAVYHKSVYDASGNQFSASLNSNAAYSDLGSAIWGAGMTSSTLGLTSDGVVTAGAVSLAYAWHSVDGFSKFGKYTGNGSTNGPFGYTGFRPAWFLVKRIDTANDWQLFDSARNPFNPVDRRLYPNLTNVEAVGSTSDIFDFTANGFKVREDNAAINASGGTYIYMAFAEHPFVGDGTSPVTAR